MHMSALKLVYIHSMYTPLYFMFLKMATCLAETSRSLLHIQNNFNALMSIFVALLYIFE